MPLRVGGALICLLAVAAGLVMPERGFRPAATATGIGAIAKQARGMLADQARSTRRAIVAVPGLVLLFGMTLFVGLWSESFDRLWGAFLLRDIRFPSIGGLRPAMWFGLIGCVVALLSLGSTEVARRRTRRLGPDSVVGALLVLTVAIAVAVVALATAHVFAIAVLAYLIVSLLRPVFDPLVSGWLVGRIEPQVRATALSAKDMFDSAGQIVGGPLVGVIGTLASTRAGLLAGAAAMGPAAGCLAAASRRISPRESVADPQADVAMSAGPAIG